MPRRNRKKKAAAQMKQNEKAVAAVPGSSEAYKLKGVEAFKNGKFPAAVEHFSKAIEKDSANAALYSNRSATYALMKNYTHSLEDANKTIELKESWVKGYYRKGHACEGLLLYTDAYGAYQAGLKIAPEDASLKKAAKDLSVLLDELKITEAELKEDNPDSDKFQGMVKWMKKEGSVFPKLYLQYYGEDYRGVHCLTKIPGSDRILYVPYKCIMTSEVAKESEIGQSIINSSVDLRSKHSYLASYLLQERHKKDSFWMPYINILPIFYANMPIFFKEDLLLWLTGSFSLMKIADRIDSLRKEYDNIRRAVPAFNKFHLEDFVWARLVVITRIFGININKKKTDGLVPYADMLNHKIPRETSWTFDDKSFGFIITTLKTCQRGQEIFDSYGRKCNSRFFVNYGFAIDDNADAEALIQVKLPRSDPQYAMKIRFLGGQESYAEREFQIPASYREKKGKEFFSFLRFIFARDSELLVVSSGDGFKIDDIEPISIRNEIEVLKHMSKVCRRHLKCFEHTLEHDNKLLESGELKMYSNERNSVVMRRGEKRVLNWFVDLATKATKYLEMPWKDLKRIAARCYQSTDLHDHYITMVVVPLVKKSN